MATQSHCCLVFDTLCARFDKRPVKSLSHFRKLLSEGPTSVADTDAYPLFVTYNTISKSGSKRLRGCIGTFSAQPLEQTIKQYAIIAAMEDKRFDQIQKRELDMLEAGVSILTNFEDIEDPYDWTLGTHGLQVHFMFNGKGRSATFLPDVALEQGWTQDDTLRNLFRKGGWDGAGDWRNLQIDLERYQSTKASLSYSQYQELIR